MSQQNSHTRRSFLKHATAGSFVGLTAGRCFSKPAIKKPVVQTVLGPIVPEKLGAVLMHEHAPIVDWSELYETEPAPVAPIRKKMLRRTAAMLDKFHDSLTKQQGPGAIVETTPIRVGRYPQLLVELARQTKVHIIASSGFWCEALAPQHPWAVRLGVDKDGIKKMAKLFIREVTEGMEDPSGNWGEKFTKIRAGIIKIGTSSYLRPSERAVHMAAALASRETGCPITTHTTNGGGLEEAELLIKQKVRPERIIIGHQGNMDDRQNAEANDYHRLIAALGCYVQFDRVDHKEYEVDKQARQIKHLLDGGFEKQILLSHDHAPYYYPGFADRKKRPDGWKALDPDYTTVTTALVAEFKKIGITQKQIQTMLVENPQRALVF